MADASLALAERRAGDLKDAVERMGQAPPSGRQMLALRAMGLLIPPASAGILARLRGVVLIILLIAVLLAVGTGIVEHLSLPFGGLGVAPSVLLGLFVVIAAVGVVAAIGRRRRDRAAEGRRLTGRLRPDAPSVGPSAEDAGGGQTTLAQCRGRVCLIVNPVAGGGKAGSVSLPLSSGQLAAGAVGAPRRHARPGACARTRAWSGDGR